ncbi:hypothetical protein C8Q78DRAFT_991761 [Trametes maxima]|nr:hypothetical protein C8Q78DRAFT_991761 [Trametes maxima]
MHTRILALAPCGGNVTTIIVLYNGCESERSPSITGAAIAGSIILGVIFLLLIGGLFYTGYYRGLQNRSSALLGSHNTQSMNLWAGPHRGWLQPANARLTSLFPAARSRWDAAIERVRVTPPPRAFFAPPPPYEPELFLPSYDAATASQAITNSPGGRAPNGVRGPDSSMAASSAVSPPAQSRS